MPSCLLSSHDCKLVQDSSRNRLVLRVQHVGEVKVKLHRALPTDATIKHVVIKRRASGWYVCLMLELPDVATAPNNLPPIGIDLGLLRLLTLSDGSEIDNPRWLRGALADLRIGQCRMAQGLESRRDFVR